MSTASEQVRADIEAAEAAEKASMQPPEVQQEAMADSVADTSAQPVPGEAIQNAGVQTDTQVQTNAPDSVPMKDYRQLKDQFNGTKGNLKQLQEQLAAMSRDLEAEKARSKALARATQSQHVVQQPQVATVNPKDRYADIIDALGPEAGQLLANKLDAIYGEIDSVRKAGNELKPQLLQETQRQSELQRQQAETAAYEAQICQSIPGLKQLWEDGEFQDWLVSSARFGLSMRQHFGNAFNARSTDDIKGIVSDYADFRTRTGQDVPAALKNNNTAANPVNNKSGLAAHVTPNRTSSSPAQQPSAPTGKVTEDEVVAAQDLVNNALSGRIKATSAEIDAARQLVGRYERENGMA